MMHGPINIRYENYCFLGYDAMRFGIYVFHSTFNVHVVGIRFCVKEANWVFIF